MDQYELMALAETIREGNCILVLGPKVAVRRQNPKVPLEELLAEELSADLPLPDQEPEQSRRNLRRITELFRQKLNYRRDQEARELGVRVRSFYLKENETGKPTEFHQDLARLPFKLCICASPDGIMYRAFENAGKKPQRAYYNWRKAFAGRLKIPDSESPIVYYLFGYYDEPQSLVLTENDLIVFLVKIIQGQPPVPDQVRSLLLDNESSFLFIGFGFHNCYLRVLLRVLNVYGRRSIAFEDEDFFGHPDHHQTNAFFSTDGTVQFHQLDWDRFARQLHEEYRTRCGTAAKMAGHVSQQQMNWPQAFISYASEDENTVVRLQERLTDHGILVWRDKQNLRAGDRWQSALRKVIEDTDYFILLETPAMKSRVEGVFNEEIEAARQRENRMSDFNGQKFRFLLPVRTTYEDFCASSLKEFHSQRIDVDSGSGIEDLARAILEDWEKRLIKRNRQIG